MTSLQRLLIKTATLGLAIAAVAPAHAIVLLNFDAVVTGDTPNGTPPWATLSIQNSGSDEVQMTLSHNASSAPGQFISMLWLNISPYPSSPSLSENSPKLTDWRFDHNDINAAGMIFDMRVEFATSNSNGGANRLKPGESVTWNVSGNSLTEDSFRAFSGGNRQVLGLVHIQGIDDHGDGGNEGSGKIAAVPEPASMAGLALALGALVARRRKRA